MGSVRIEVVACASGSFGSGGLVLWTFSHPGTDDGKITKVISGFADVDAPPQTSASILTRHLPRPLCLASSAS